MISRTTLSYVLTILAGLAVLASLFFLFNAQAHVAKAGGQSVGCFDIITNGTVAQGCRAHATTTPLYLTAAAATTTMVVNVANASSVNMNLRVEASSTSAIFTWTVARSDNGIDWYLDDVSSTSAATITHTAGRATNSWTPGTVATTSKSVTIPTVATKYLRVGFQAITANGSLYAQIIPQNQITN